MKIEEEIKQSKFKNEFQKLSINLLVTANWLENHHKSFMKDFDITLQQYNVLRILRGQSPKPISVSDIRDRMMDKMSDVSRIVERLRLQGYIQRLECPKDRRLVDVTITEKGLELLSEMDEKITELDNIMRKIGESDAQLMNQLLDKIRS
jgi:DNA-binding MarR family transcriptional regulator